MVTQVRENRDDVHWVMQDSLVIPGTRVRAPYTNRFYEKLANMYDLITVTPPRLREKSANTDMSSHVLKIARTFRKGDVIGLYPETKNSVTIRKGHYLAGELANFLAKMRSDAKVVPIGLFSEGEVLTANIGKPFPVLQILNFDPEVVEAKSQEEVKKKFEKLATFILMRRINPLVPQEYRNSNF